MSMQLLNNSVYYIGDTNVYVTYLKTVMIYWFAKELLISISVLKLSESLNRRILKWYEYKQHPRRR